MSRADQETPMDTVKIKVTPCEGNEEGCVIINKSDYDPGQHELYDEKKAEGGKSEKAAGKDKEKGAGAAGAKAEGGKSEKAEK
jgi:hypothetical protein